MPTFNNGESGSSVRTKINDAIDKVDGNAPITSADVNGGTIDGTVIGGSTPAAGSFTAVSATSGDLNLDTLDLNAIAASKSVTAVDVFVYDTSKDSDGGAWRKRTQGTSWYNETLNTATRGSRREFPAVAVIVMTNVQLTIYDGDDPALPMWMVFENAGSLSWASGSAVLYNSVSALNGKIIPASTTGAVIYDFPLDDTRLANVATYELTSNRALVGRNGATSFASGGDGYALVSSVSNDVAMTVLPNAPIDAATGLPVPTIAVATDGNSTYSTSIITDEGSVYDIASDSTGTAVSVAFDGVSLSVVRSDGTVYVWDNAGGIAADGASPDATYSASSTPALLGTVSRVAA